MLTDEAGRIYEKQGTLSDDTVTVDGLPGGIYTGTAVLNIKGNTARKVTLAEQELVLEQAGEMNREEVWQAAELILAIGTVDAGEACGARIQAAQAAYRKLTQGQKESFSQSLEGSAGERKDPLPEASSGGDGQEGSRRGCGSDQQNRRSAF